MAGDEDRPQPGPTDAVPPDVPESEAIPAREPSMAAGAADLATPDRPAESFGAAPATAARPRRSLMPTVLAAIGLVLILLLAANLYTLYNPPANDAVPALQRDAAALQSESAALKQRLVALEARPPVDLGPLDGRVTAVAGDVAALKTAIDHNTEAVQAGVDAKAAVAETSAAAKANGTALADLGTRLSGMQDAVAALPKVDLAPLESKLTGLETRVGDLDPALASLQTRVAGFDPVLAGFDKRMMPLEAYFNAPKSPVQATEMRQNGSAAETRAAPLAVLAQGILSAIPTGKPFAAETKALAALGVDPGKLAPLQAVAGTGAATDQDLVQGFASMQDAIVVAAAPVSTGTMFDRIMANAQSVVKVTRTGAGAGEGSDAIASRIAADLKAGALPAAAAGWETLPEASRARSAEWAARLKARIAAETAARSIEAGAVDALAASK